MSLLPSRMAINRTNHLASAVRDAGRRVQAGKAIDLEPIAGLLDAWCIAHPTEGAQLRGMLAVAEVEATNGTIESALQAFRAAIDFVSEVDQGKGII